MIPDCVFLGDACSAMTSRHVFFPPHDRVPTLLVHFLLPFAAFPDDDTLLVALLLK